MRILQSIVHCLLYIYVTVHRVLTQLAKLIAYEEVEIRQRRMGLLVKKYNNYKNLYKIVKEKSMFIMNVRNGVYFYFLDIFVAENEFVRD